MRFKLPAGHLLDKLTNAPFSKTMFRFFFPTNMLKKNSNTED